MNTTTLQTGNVAYGPTKRISWNAIFAGAIVAIFTEFLLNLLGLGLGFTAFTVNADVLTNIGIGTIAWLILSSIISLFLGGWVAGRLAPVNLSLEGILHGLVTAGVVTLLTFILMATTAGSIISGTLNLIGQSISLTGKGVTTLGRSTMQIAPQLSDTAKNMLPDLSPAVDEIKQQADQLLTQAKETTSQAMQNNISPEEAKAQLEQAITGLFTARENDSNSARQKLIDYLVQNANMNSQQAEDTVNNWQQKYAEMKQQIYQKAEQAKLTVIETTEKTSNVLGTVAIVTFVVFLLGAAASAVGGMAGATRGNKRIAA